MTFTEWLEKDGVGCDAIELKLQRAWDAAKADAEKDLAGWTKAAYEDGKLAMEGKCQAEIVRMREALEKIADVFTYETDPTLACHTIQAILKYLKR